MNYRADKVFAADEQVGISCGRIHSYGYSAMISISFVNQDYAAEGTELTVLWGTPGTKQMPVRATVKKTGYNCIPMMPPRFWFKGEVPSVYRRKPIL